jgi:hypothetical protein
MNVNSQAQRGCVGCAGGIPNYKNVEDGPPFAGIEFSDGGGDEAGEEDIKMATANITVNEMISSERAEGAAEVHPCPPLLPAFDSSRVSNTAATIVLSSGSRGVIAKICNQQQGGICHQCPTPVGRRAKEVLKILPIMNGGPSPRHWIG